MARPTVGVARRVTGGVDTHLELNVAAGVDHIGGVLGVAEFPTTSAGHKGLLDWLESFGEVVSVGVEGTGSYGTGLARFLRGAGVQVLEVDRPNRRSRRRTGKSDPADAVEAARAALSGRAQGAGKSRDGNVEAIRALVVAKRSARSSKVKALNQIRHLGFTASDDLRGRLDGVSREHLGTTAALLRPRVGSDPVTFATQTALRTWANGCWPSTRRRHTSTSWSESWSRRPRPPCSSSTAWAWTPRRPCSSPRATTPSGSVRKRPGRICAGWPPSRPPRARSCACGSTAAVTVRRTMPCGAS